ncbi:hypothetical protein SDC9_84973 [bioreactor metagenome]|uniref:Uncharacterized protein n=1 Tax=bioreactor metagenome TaxID=1076179 RepID=A0A644ZKP7_9ZZZZ
MLAVELVQVAVPVDLVRPPREQSHALHSATGRKPPDSAGPLTRTALIRRTGLTRATLVGTGLTRRCSPGRGSPEQSDDVRADVLDHVAGPDRTPADRRDQGRQAGQRLVGHVETWRVRRQQRVAAVGPLLGELVPGVQPGLGDLGHRRHAEEVPDGGVVTQRDDAGVLVDPGQPHPGVEVAAVLERGAQGEAAGRRAGLTDVGSLAGLDGGVVHRADRQGVAEPGVEPVEVGGVAGHVAVAGVEGALRGGPLGGGVRAGRVVGAPQAVGGGTHPGRVTGMAEGAFPGEVAEVLADQVGGDDDLERLMTRGPQLDHLEHQLVQRDQRPESTTVGFTRLEREPGGGQ